MRVFFGYSLPRVRQTRGSSRGKCGDEKVAFVHGRRRAHVCRVVSWARFGAVAGLDLVRQQGESLGRSTDQRLHERHPVRQGNQEKPRRSPSTTAATAIAAKSDNDNAPWPTTTRRSGSIQSTRYALQRPRQRLTNDKKDYDRAIADYNEAIRLDPKYASAVQRPRQRLSRPRRTTTAPSPTTTRSIQPRSRNTTLPHNGRGNAYYRQEGLRPRHRPTIARRSGSIPKIRSRLQRPRQRLSRQERLRPRHRRLQRIDAT